MSDASRTDMAERPSALEDYEFDLRGFLVIRGALNPAEVAALDTAYDRFPDLANGAWYGNARDHPVHSGGHDASIRTQFGYRNVRFRCGQLNVLVTLRDIGPGDGPTMIVPGSHKQHLAHPLIGDYARGDRMDTLPWAEPVYAEAGDALLFVDSCLHGASTRTNDGLRRVVILRYGPPWARSRFGYTVSDGLLERLTPARRTIMMPVLPHPAGSTHVPLDLHAEQRE